MSMLQKIIAALLCALLLAAGYGLWATNDPSAAPVQKKSALVVVTPASAIPVIDEHTLLVAQRLARYANTPEEQALAQSAVQVADHELDLAFAAALHHLETHPPPQSPQATRIQQHIDELQKVLAADTQAVSQLTASLAKASDADKPALQDRLDLAQSQVALEQDEIQEANEQLLQAGGNVHQRIQTMQQEHEAAERKAASAAPAATEDALTRLKGMVGRIRQWLTLHRKERWLGWARAHVSESADQLAVERARIAAELAANKALVPQFSTHAQHAGGGAAPAIAAGAKPAPAAPATKPCPLPPRRRACCLRPPPRPRRFSSSPGSSPPTSTA